MGKYIDGSGLSHFMGIIKGALAGKSDTGHTHSQYVPTSRTVNGHALSANVTVTASDIGVAAGAEVNQNAFSNVKVGSTTVAADSKTDTLELVAGSNVTLTPDATNDKVTIAATDTVYTHPSHTDHSTSAIYKFTNDALGHVNAATAATASDIVSLLDATAVNRATADASGNNIASTYATKDELGAATAGALQYKGTVNAESTITGAAYKKGWYYVVATAGTYLGKVCEVGDMLIAKQDKTGTPANDWDAVQSNIETLSNSEIDALWAAA